MPDFVWAMTLDNPWAALVAGGAKMVETRWPGWNYSHRGDLVIHAGRTRRGMHHTMEPRFRRALEAAGFDPFNLPFGAALCVVEFYKNEPAPALAPWLSDDERAFGNYGREALKSDPGKLLDRRALRFRNLRRFKKPVPFNGSQGLWPFPAGLIPELIPVPTWADQPPKS